MTKLINTRPLFEAISNKRYSSAMREYFRKLDITDFKVKYTWSNPFKENVNIYISMEDWKRVKELITHKE